MPYQSETLPTHQITCPFHPTYLRTSIHSPMRYEFKISPSILRISVLRFICQMPIRYQSKISYVSPYSNLFSNVRNMMTLPAHQIPHLFHPTYLRTQIHSPMRGTIQNLHLQDVSSSFFDSISEEYDDIAHPSDTSPLPSYVSPYSNSFANARNNSKSLRSLIHS